MRMHLFVFTDNTLLFEINHEYLMFPFNNSTIPISKYIDLCTIKEFHFSGRLNIHAINKIFRVIDHSCPYKNENFE